jgi:hypothetical protein
MAATNDLSIKLLINTKTRKLCFAEASGDVVEFLTGLLSLPLGTVTSLLVKEGMPGSVGTLLGRRPRDAFLPAGAAGFPPQQRER